MDRGIFRALVSDNAWLDGANVELWFETFLPDPFQPRHLRLSDDRRRVHLVVGPRQAGKSTLIWKTLAERGEPAFYINCEDPSMREWLTSPARFLVDLSEIGAGEGLPLFFEEVQALDEAGLFLKGLVDRKIGRAIYATGSSAFDLESRTRETLAGRARRHLLLPFSIDELPGSDHPSGSLLERAERRRLAKRAAVLGNYPGVWASSRPEDELADLAEAFVLRDVSDRFDIRHLGAFRKIVQLAASQIGNLVNFSEWASLAAIANDTVAHYCQLLDGAHIIRLVRPFVGGKRAEITSSPKVFFLDNGLRNQIFGGFTSLEERADRGALMENLAFSELSKVLNPLLDGLRYWRSKSGAEVDFVVEHQGRLLAVEVKAGDAHGKVGRGQRSFVEAYRPERLLVVNDGEHPSREVGESQVDFLGIERLAGTVRHWLDHPPGRIPRDASA